MRGVVRGVTVVDDYGHHPTEIAATLRAARDAGYKRVHVLFQPHRYTRTRDLLPEFARAFADADTLRVLDIYAASEEPIAGVDAHALVEAIRRTATVGGGVDYAPSMAEGAREIARAAREGDAVILTLGAGVIQHLAAAMKAGELGPAIILLEDQTLAVCCGMPSNSPKLQIAEVIRCRVSATT